MNVRARGVKLRSRGITLGGGSVPGGPRVSTARPWGNDNGPQSRTESAPPGTDWSTEPAWGAQAPQTVGWANPATDNPATHTETAEPKKY